MTWDELLARQDLSGSERLELGRMRLMGMAPCDAHEAVRWRRLCPWLNLAGFAVAFGIAALAAALS